MLGLPKTTEVNKRIPKQALHNNMQLTPMLKRVLTEQVDSIYWRNKIADDTMNLGKGNTVTEIQIFEIRLNSSNLNTELLRQIDKQVYYHVLFLLEYKLIKKKPKRGIMLLKSMIITIQTDYLKRNCSLILKG